MRFGWLAPLVPVSVVPDSWVLDSQVLPTFAGRSGLGSAGRPPVLRARGMGPKVVRPWDVPGPVAEPVRGFEGRASLHLRQGGETIAGSGFNRIARWLSVLLLGAVLEPISSGSGSVSDLVSID